MSSDTSTASSRIRQFGLYRTVDARTEEFLKLSRRRQLRQGCACAAVSTAITVTVVVSVLLAYEYGFHMETESRHRPRWLSMFNNSDAFDKNIQKSNKSTLKLLSILLKAVKDNRYLEKVIEEYSSHSSQKPEDEQQSTNYPLDRNVFTNSRNWIRMSTSKLYASEHKSSPIVFFKSRNVDDFAKSAKIMNSQRIISYINRMIKEKVSDGPVAHTFSYNPFKSISSTPVPKIALSYPKEKRHKTMHIRNKGVTRSTEIDKTDCKCPNNLGDILNKLLNSIQQLLPEKKESGFDEFLCDGNKVRTKTKQDNTFVNTNRTTSIKEILKRTTKNITVKGDVPLKYKVDKKSMMRKPKSNNSIEKIISSLKKQNKIPSKAFTNAILLRNHQKKDKRIRNDTYATHILEDNTTMKLQIEPTEGYIFEIITTTEPMTAFTVKTLDSRLTDLGKNILKHEPYQDYGDVFPPTVTIKTESSSEDDDAKMKETTVSFMQKIQAYNAPLNKNNSKSKMVATSKIQRQIEPLKSFTLERQDDKSEWNYSLSPKSFIYHHELYDYNTTYETTERVNFNNITNYNISGVLKAKKYPKRVKSLDSFLLAHHDFGNLSQSYPTSNYNLYNNEDSKTKRTPTMLGMFFDKLKEINKYNINYPNEINKKEEHVQINTLDEMENTHKHDQLNIQKVLESVSNSVEFGASLDYNTSGPLVKGSMIPQSRPSFLEIRRSDGRREDYDEDTNIIMNNFIID